MVATVPPVLGPVLHPQTAVLALRRPGSTSSTITTSTATTLDGITRSSHILSD
uniref:Uncharacterized protein n=1 Tax=Rhizophora mucronata TaxID=61149 RepID=A0A2P2N1R7_RHIMU